MNARCARGARACRVREGQQPAQKAIGTIELGFDRIELVGLDGGA
jgi:hypothetical protein